jgi:exopolyphosphatase/guanosine-5'-triphosphate,3'-diphosphate pyrophosphatase
MRLAAIDLGTNTIHLLVGETDVTTGWRAVHREQQVTRLGEGLWPAGVLGDLPMARTADGVVAFVERARMLGAARVRIVATSAMREAANGRAFAATLEARTGVRVEIVSGTEEARLTLRGVLDAIGRPRGTVLLFDIGGGSTEYTLARDGGVIASVSLSLGVVALTERFPFPGPVDRARYEAMQAEVRAQLDRELPSALGSTPVDELVGTAGTVTALAALDLDLASYDPDRVQGHRLARAAVEAQLRRLSALTVEERAELPCLERGRADLIVPGTAIVLATMDRLGRDTLLVSDAALREGMMAEAAERALYAGGAS